MDKTKPFNELTPISGIHLEETRELLKLAEDTRVSIEILNFAVSTLPSSEILFDTLTLQEAKVSSYIENIVTTNDDLYRGIAFDSYTAEAKEVANYKEALLEGYKRLKKTGTLSIGDIEIINNMVNRKQLGIRVNMPEFESSYTKIVNHIADSVEIIYTPPHGKELINTLLLDLLEYIYDDESYPVHPLIKIALAHYQFESIHPFYDGNGRTGRMLNVLFLCHKEYMNSPILYASSFIIKNKNEYYGLLNTCTEIGNYEAIIEYMLKSFNVTAKKTLTVVMEMKKLIEKYSSDNFLKDFKGQTEVLKSAINIIFEKVYVRIEDLVKMGIHRQTASTYLKQFVDAGLLSEQKAGKEKIFKNIELLNLFEGE